MSLILDALRKSEAERKRGQKPDLFASVTLSPAPRRANLLRYWPLPVFVALLLAAGFVLWQGRELPEATTTPALSESTQDEASSESSVDGSAEVGMRPMPAPPTVADSTPAPPPAQVASEPASAAGTLAPNATLPSSNPTSAPARSIPPMPMPTPSPANATDSAASAPPPRNDEAQLEALPPIAILGASERSALPPLKLSMHVFGNEPGKRFAIIDGQRVTEGSSLGGSIIEEIRRDGVVLNINGRRILLPRP